MPALGSTEQGRSYKLPPIVQLPRLLQPVPCCPTAQAVPSQRDPADPTTQLSAILGLLSSPV